MKETSPPTPGGNIAQIKQNTAMDVIQPRFVQKLVEEN